MKKSWLVLNSVFLTLYLTGCGGNDNHAGENGNNEGPQIQTNQDGPGNRNINNRNNGNTLMVSEQAERQVEQMKEVDEAHVIISNNNAYVTVRLANDNNAAGRGNASHENFDNRGNVRVDDKLDGNGKTFMENGTVNQGNNNRAGESGLIDGKGDAGTGGKNKILGNGNGSANENGNNLNNGPSPNKGTALQKNNYSDVSNSFEQQIADQVRKADNKIHKVYVSVNPDLYSKMGTFAEDIRTDRNRAGLFDDFTNTVNDFFDTND